MVSVLLPVRDGERYLPEALESVLGQSLRELELVVVDDGSRDRSRDLAEARASRDPRVRVVQGPGRGISAATNAGLAACRGRYIARMDQDDRCRPRRLELQAAFLDAHPGVGIVGGQKRLFGSPGLRQYRYPTSHADIQAAVFFYCPVLGPTSLFRADLVPPGGALYDPAEDFAEDYGLLSRWLAAGVGAAVLDEVVLDYRVHPAQSGAVHAPRLAAAADRIRLAWLGRLGLEPDPAERELHLAAGRGEWGRGLEWLGRLEAWFLKLRAARARVGFPEAEAFDRTLARRWAAALWANRGLGGGLARRAFRSPLARLPHPEPWKAWAARLGAFLPAPS